MSPAPSWARASAGRIKMSVRYSIRDFAHFTGLFWRNRERQKLWGRRFEAAVRDQSFKLPTATVVQLLPTETCNLRCPMCNQWGENGYFLSGVRQAQHMDETALIRLMRGLSPRQTM